MIETKHDPHIWYANRVFSEMNIDDSDEIDIIKLKEIIWYYENKHTTHEHLKALMDKLVEQEYYRAAIQIQNIIKK